MPQASPTATILAGTAAALAAAAVYNTYRARKIEQENPPRGCFVEVEGVRLHYLERGTGAPVVLIHGNVVSAEDWVLSGVLDLVALRHRVIAFDRPGFGHSERPHGRLWTAGAQAGLLRQAFGQLGVVRPIVVGHSWGTIVAVAMALAEPAAVRGLVLLGGYYHPTLRADVLQSLPQAAPVLGDVLRHTLSPPLTEATMPLIAQAMFAPMAVPERFKAGSDYRGMAARPSQLRGISQEGATMVPSVAVMQGHYGELGMPVAIMAGKEDQVLDVGRQSIRLHEQIPGSRLELVPGAGHMVHWAAPDAAALLVEAVSGASRGRAPRLAA